MLKIMKLGYIKDKIDFYAYKSIANNFFVIYNRIINK